MSVTGEGVGSQSSYEGISDLLKCYICFDRLLDAVMCPHCSKICCYHCIKKWISTAKPECPHCRARLSDCDLIRVPSVQDLSDYIDRKQPQSLDKEFCRYHPQLTLTVYCETCSECICSDCALWGGHRADQGHSIKPLEELYKQHRKVLEKKLSKLQDYLKDILSLVEHIEITMDRTKGQKEKTQQEIEKVMEDVIGRLHDQLRMKLRKMTDGKHYLKRQACQITTISTEIEGKIRGSQSLIVSQREELQEKLTNALAELESSKMTELEKKPEVGSFINEIVPAYETAVFEIKDFSKKQLSGEEIYSSHLTYCGLSWRLKVYPNGTEGFSGRYLGVFVELYDGYSQTVMYNYFVEMVYGAGHRSPPSRARTGNFKRDYGSDFAVGEAWGYKKFYELKNLETKGFLVNDTLLLRFGVRHPTYHQKTRDCLLYINDLKHKIMALKHQNSQLRHKCEGISDEADDVSILKMKNKSRKVRSPKDIQEQSLESDQKGPAVELEKKKSIEKKKEDKDTQRTHEEEMTENDRGSTGGGSGPGSRAKLGKTPISLSQPHFHTIHDSRMQHRMEKEHTRRSSGLHPSHSMLAHSPSQRTRHQQQTQGVNYGHCIQQHRRKPDEVMERRQSYDPARMQQMMYEHQSLMTQQMYPGNLSQADYMMMPPTHRGEYFTTIRENPPEPLDWMGGMGQSQSSPRRQPHPPRKESSQTDINYFMDDPGSPGTFNGDSNSQPHHNYFTQLSQEYHEYELADIPSVNTPIDDSFASQKFGYGMTEMSQPIDHMSYIRKKSSDPMTLAEMDQLSRSYQTLQNDGGHGFKGDNTRRKPVRTKSTTHRPTSSNHLKSMGSEPQLNMYSGAPGLQSSILNRLNAPVEQLRAGSSSTLPHRGNKSNSAAGNHGRSHSRHQTSGSVQQYTKQPAAPQQLNGGSSMTQPSRPLPTTPGTHAVPVEEAIKHSPSNQSRSSLFVSTSTTSTTSTTSSTPSSTSPSSHLQQRLEEQSPSNQKLRSSGRSYKQSKKYLEGRSSPSKPCPKQKITLEVKSSPPDNAGSNRLTVGGNITNNTSLSQLDKLL